MSLDFSPLPGQHPLTPTLAPLRGRGSRKILARYSGRQLVAVWRRRYLEGVHNPAQDTEIVRGRRQLDQPLHTVPVLEGIKGCLVDTVVADQLLGVGHDLALFDGQSGWIFPSPDHVDS